MTDVTLPQIPERPARRLDVVSPEAKRRVAARYRSERRFRAYGIAAIAFAGIFLVLLVGDVMRRAFPAFTINDFAAEMSLSKEALDPNGTGRIDDIMQSGDFDAPVRDALRAALPEMKSRAERRAISSVLSQTGAGDRLRAEIRANPALIGQTTRMSAILDPNVDLYLKGQITALESASGRGEATPSEASGSIAITTTSDDFKATLEALREDAAAVARTIERELVSIRGALATGTAEENAALQARADELTASLAEIQVVMAGGNATDKLTEAMPTLLVDINGGVVRATEIGADRIVGDVIFPLANADRAQAGDWSVRRIVVPAGLRKVTDEQIVFTEKLKERGFIARGFNAPFFFGKDSAQPETAGILSGLVGSALMLLVTLLFCLPVGVAAAIYLEEFAPRNAFTRLVEININNLAAVPSIIFGLLGMAVFINLFGLGRGTLIVGGLVLALLVLPTIIIASRAALRAVPPSIREAALGIGASKQQAVFQHVLPLAMPGIMTGTIIGMAHALGETAPLLMIGMLASAPDVPTSIFSAGSALPSTIYNWSDQAEAGFTSRTAAAIIVLLLFLFVMNGVAIWLRKRFERKW
jgi:phosphate transport system permease protein